MASTWDLPEDTNYDLEHLPPFANDENKNLAREIKEKQRQILQLDSEIDVNQGRVQRMKEHMKNVQSEIQNTESIYLARKKEFETESHLNQLAKRESGKLSSETERLKREEEEWVDRSARMQQQLMRTRELIDQEREELRIQKDELEQWEEAARQQDEDWEAVQEYSRHDAQKINALTLQTEKQYKLLRQRQGLLEKEVTETRAAQIELNKTAGEFRALHKDRQELLEQWSSALEVMERRDVSLQAAHDELLEIQSDLKEQQLQIREREKFLQAQRETNRQLEQQLHNAERTLTTRRTEYGEAQNSLVEYQSELEAVKNTLTKVATNLDSKRAEIIFLKQQIEQKELRIERERANVEKTEYNLKVHYQATSDLDARAKQLDMYYKEEQIGLQKIELEQRDLKQQLFKESQDLFRLRQEEQNLLSELSGSRVAEKNLQAKINKLDTESLKQQELVYNQEYQLQQLERKISRAQGERSNEEKYLLNVKIKELSAQLDEQNQKKILLTNQHKRIGDEVRAAKNKLEQEIHSEKNQLNVKINEINLENESAQRALKQASKKREELLVAENFVRLDVKRLKDLLYSRVDEVFSLENRKEQLKLSMQQRREEITVHRERLRAQLRTEEEERHQRQKELSQRLAAVEKLKRNYQLLVRQFSPEGEEEHSQAYFIIRAAQQKEELKKQLDSLDAEISKAEKEIWGLENSLASFNSLNQRLHTQKTRGGMTAEETQQVELLEHQLQQLQLTRKEKVAKAKSWEQHLRQLEAQNEALTSLVNQRRHQFSQSREQHDILLRDLHQLAHRSSRAQQRLQNLSRNGEAEILSGRFLLRLRLRRLLRFAAAHPPLEEILRERLGQFGLSPPPSLPTSAATSPATSLHGTPTASPRVSTSRGVPRKTPRKASTASAPSSRCTAHRPVVTPTTVAINPSTMASPLAFRGSSEATQTWRAPSRLRTAPEKGSGKAGSSRSGLPVIVSRQLTPTGTGRVSQQRL